MFSALWNYRGFVLSSIKIDFLSRFARSKLGGLWMIVHPLMQVIIFALVLSNVLAAKLPGIENKNAYALYLMAGTLGWNLFSETITRCLTLFVDQGSVMKKISFPKITLPTILVGSTLLNNALLFFSILFIFTLLGQYPTVQVLWVPVLSLILVTMALGIGLLLGTLNVFFRDVGQLVPVLLQITFWFTPIVYPVSAIPPEFEGFLGYNPLYPVIKAYQNVLVYGVMPDFEPLLATLILSLTLLLISLVVFRRASPELVDML